MFFSVIIPCYNREATVARSINSVLAQSFLNYEIIAVDDGSTDNTASVIQAFIDKRVKYTYQENKGVSTARNTGASMAQGQFLIFLDSDDEMLPNALNSYYELLSENPAKLAFGQIEGKTYKSVSVGPKFFKGYPVRNIPGSFAIATNFFKQIGGYTDGASHSENWELMIRAIYSQHLEAQQVCYTENYVVRYNIWRTSEKRRANIKKKIHSYQLFYKNYYGSPLNRFAPHFSHVLAKNYAGSGELFNAIKWIGKSLAFNRDAFRYIFKPLGIYIKRKLIPH